MGAVVVLEWGFSPPDYFEVPIEISRDDYTLTIAHGESRGKARFGSLRSEPFYATDPPRGAER